MPKSTSAGSVIVAGGGGPADHRRQRAGHRADQRGERRARLERRVDEHVADSVARGDGGSGEVGAERELDESGDDEQHAEPRALGRRRAGRAAAAVCACAASARSVSRSHTWFSAAAPPATSAVPTSVCTSERQRRRRPVTPGRDRPSVVMRTSRLSRGLVSVTKSSVRPERATLRVGRRWHRCAADDLRARLHA